MSNIEDVITSFNSNFNCAVELDPNEEPVFRPDGGTMSWRVYSPSPHGVGFGVEVVVAGWVWNEFTTGDWGCEVELVLDSGIGSGMGGKGGVSLKYWYVEDDDSWEGPSNIVFG